MARLVIDTHPDRVFKDESWAGYVSADGYRSIGSTAYPLPRYGELWAFAVPLDEGSNLERRLFDDIVNLRAPFVAAEVCKLQDGTLCAIGFYPEPND